MRDFTKLLIYYSKYFNFEIIGRKRWIWFYIHWPCQYLKINIVYMNNLDEKVVLYRDKSSNIGAVRPLFLRGRKGA